MLKFVEKEIKFIPAGKEFFYLIKRSGSNVIHKEVVRNVAVYTEYYFSFEKTYFTVQTESERKILINEASKLYDSHQDALSEKDLSIFTEAIYQKVTVKMIRLGEIVTVKLKDENEAFQCFISGIHVKIDEEKVFVKYSAQSLVSSKTWVIKSEDILF